MIDEDLRQIREVLSRAVQASGILRRDLERALRLRNGSLAQLLEGRLDLRVEHVTALARLLRIPPGDLLAAGAHSTNAAAEHRLADWLAGTAETTARDAPPASPSPEELAAMVRSAIREALARLDTPPGS
jgi:transcriptional regulator with XRE-family HTH domain